jgi:hypothetical protein
VKSCPTGDNQAYVECRNDCYNKYYWSDGSGTATSNNQATATGSEGMRSLQRG